MDYFLSHIPIYNIFHRRRWIKNKFKFIKNDVNNVLIKDDENEEIAWEVIEYYIGLSYDFIFYNEPFGPGLRINPLKLIK